MEKILEKIKETSVIFSSCDTETKNRILKNITKNLLEKKNKIIEQNNIDIDNAAKDGISTPLLKRLKLDSDKLNVCIKGIEDLIKLEDPSNRVLAKTLLDDGLILTKISVPIGVIGIIFESRPDALIQIATLCLKSGNCAVLKGGKEAYNTNKILTEIIVDSIVEIESAFSNTIFLIETRDDVNKLLEYNQYIDLIIPRGSNEFVKYIMTHTTIPVLGHADGICHIFVDEEFDLDKAINVIIDAKTQYVAVCNAVETILIHEKIAKSFLPLLKKKFDEKNVKVKGSKDVKEILEDIEIIEGEQFRCEYLDYIVSIKIVKNVDEAIKHINKYGSHHTDSILSKNIKNMDKFKKEVDSSSVMINCSTRFSDGFRYGFGAEVGISTSKIHSRGPVGLDGLVIYKYILEGNGDIVKEYADNIKHFKHIKMEI